MSYIATGFEAEIESHPAAFHAAERNRRFVFVKTTRAISSFPLGLQRMAFAVAGFNGKSCGVGQKVAGGFT